MSRTLVHLSDIHFGRVDPVVIDPLLCAVRRLAPDVVVVSGDLTQRARTAEFLAAREFLDKLPEPRIVVPGNHDVPLYNLYGRFVEQLARYRQFITSDQDANSLIPATGNSRDTEADRGGILLHNGIEVVCIPCSDSLLNTSVRALFGHDGLIIRFASFISQAEGREAVLQVRKLSSAIGLSFDEFEPVDMPFHRPGTVGKRETRQNRGFVALETAGKDEEFPDSGGTHVLEPGVESFPTVVANEVQEAVSQLSCLREGAIQLRDLIQPGLGLWAKLPWTGQHPPHDLAWGHVFERRARDCLTRSGQTPLAWMLAPFRQAPIHTTARSRVAFGLQLLPKNCAIAFARLPALAQITRRPIERTASWFAGPGIGTMLLCQPVLNGPLPHSQPPGNGPCRKTCLFEREHLLIPCFTNRLAGSTCRREKGNGFGRHLGFAPSFGQSFPAS